MYPSLVGSFSDIFYILSSGNARIISSRRRFFMMQSCLRRSGHCLSRESIWKEVEERWTWGSLVVHVARVCCGSDRQCIALSPSSGASPSDSRSCYFFVFLFVGCTDVARFYCARSTRFNGNCGRCLVYNSHFGRGKLIVFLWMSSEIVAAHKGSVNGIFSGVGSLCSF
jgi:hypothetical protein